MFAASSPRRRVPARPRSPPCRRANHHPVVPMILPVLHAPNLSKASDSIDENKTELPKNDTSNPVPSKERNRDRKITQEISVHVPTLAQEQNYPRRQLNGIHTKATRYSEPKNTPYFYPTR